MHPVLGFIPLTIAAAATLEPTPGLDWTSVLVAAIVATPPSLIAFFGYRSAQAAVKAALVAATAASEAKTAASESKDAAVEAAATTVKTASAIDGRMGELLEATAGKGRAEAVVARAEGVVLGRAEGVVTGRAEGERAEAATAGREAVARAEGAAATNGRPQSSSEAASTGTVPIERVTGVVVKPKPRKPKP